MADLGQLINYMFMTQGRNAYTLNTPCNLLQVTVKLHGAHLYFKIVMPQHIFSFVNNNRLNNMFTVREEKYHLGKQKNVFVMPNELQ